MPKVQGYCEHILHKGHTFLPSTPGIEHSRVESREQRAEDILACSFKLDTDFHFVMFLACMFIFLEYSSIWSFTVARAYEKYIFSSKSSQM